MQEKKIRKLADRTIDYGLEVIDYVETLPHTAAGRHKARFAQVFKCVSNQQSATNRVEGICRSLLAVRCLHTFILKTLERSEKGYYLLSDCNHPRKSMSFATSLWS